MEVLLSGFVDKMSQLVATQPVSFFDKSRDFAFQGQFTYENDTFALAQSGYEVPFLPFSSILIFSKRTMMDKTAVLKPNTTVRDQSITLTTNVNIPWPSYANFSP